MDQTALAELLDQLIAKWEDEVVEFKEAGNDYATDKIGHYFSAMANEANLRDAERSWLVFGVKNTTRSVVGTSYRSDPERLHSLKIQMRDGTEPSVTFREIHELTHANGRVVLFEIPAAPRGMPINWKGHYYARAGESLSPLGLDKLDDIRNQTLATDWTAQIVDGATLADLDLIAISTARKRFAEKHANRISPAEVASWSDAAFLDRAKVTQNEAITRTALLLLGKAEAAFRLSPHPAQITWNLRGEEQAYEHFYPPFLLASSAIFSRIRNVQIRILPQDQLLAHEVSKYDQGVVLEALHNCIAHQDYARNARIVVTEYGDRLVFENEGGFVDGDPNDYATGAKSVPRRYRNSWLVQAMAELNMIDQMGYGIHRIYERQRQRFFPLPDYDLNDANMVQLTIHGHVVDPAYSRLLMKQTGLNLVDVLALDRVQKKLPIAEDAIKHLRTKKLIEGRKPNFYVSAQVAAATATMADYVRTRAQDDEFYAKQLTDYLKGAGTASRKQIDDLLLTKLSDALTQKQKIDKITNLLSKLRSKGRIHNAGSRKTSEWVLGEKI
jgi:ATP-dependent DNA helicase RecG